MNKEDKVLVTYTPTKLNNKWTTRVCSGNGNLGLHNQEEFKKAIKMLLVAAHTWRNPRLYHIVLTHSTLPIYQKVLNTITDKLRSAGVLVEYKASLEIQNDSKGTHKHVMMVVSTGDKRPSKYITACNEVGKEDPSLLRQAVRKVQADNSDLRVSVRSPASSTQCFLQLNQTNQDMFNEAVEWCSYIYKVRSKPTGPCYYSSRTTRRPASVADDRDMSLGLADRAVDRVLYKNNRHIGFHPRGTSTHQRIQRPVLGGLPRPTNRFTLGIRQLHQQIRPQNAFVNHLK